jgi:hypothetical protein
MISLGHTIYLSGYIRDDQARPATMITSYAGMAVMSCLSVTSTQHLHSGLNSIASLANPTLLTHKCFCDRPQLPPSLHWPTMPCRALGPDRKVNKQQGHWLSCNNDSNLNNTLPNTILYTWCRAAVSTSSPKGALQQHKTLSTAALALPSLLLLPLLSLLLTAC